MKNLVIVVLAMLVIILAYRVFDLGVTLTYSEQEYWEVQREIVTISEYQGMECSRVTASEQMRDTFFVKEGKIFIRGVEFECRTDEEGRSILFSVVEGAREITEPGK